MQTVSGINPNWSAPGSYCDTVGYFIPLSETQGTGWKITFTDSNKNAHVYSTTFTVSGSVPDLPFGVLFLLLPVIVIYMMATRRVKFALR